MRTRTSSPGCREGRGTVERLSPQHKIEGLNQSESQRKGHPEQRQASTKPARRAGGIAKPKTFDCQEAGVRLAIKHDIASEKKGTPAEGRQQILVSKPSIISPSAASEDKLRNRILLHLATNKAAQGAEGDIEAVPLDDLHERFVYNSQRVSNGQLHQALRQLISKGYAKIEKNQKYGIAELGCQAVDEVRQTLLVQAKVETSDRAVKFGLSKLQRRCKSYWASEKGWFEGIIADFDGWQHLVNYDDGDQLWLDLQKDCDDGNLELLPNTPEKKKHCGTCQGGKAEERAQAPITVNQKQQSHSDQKHRPLLSPSLPDIQQELYTGAFDIARCEEQGRLPEQEQQMAQVKREAARQVPKPDRNSLFTARNDSQEKLKTKVTSITPSSLKPIFEAMIRSRPASGDDASLVDGSLQTKADCEPFPCSVPCGMQHGETVLQDTLAGQSTNPAVAVGYPDAAKIFSRYSRATNSTAVQQDQHLAGVQAVRMGVAAVMHDDSIQPSQAPWRSARLQPQEPCAVNQAAEPDNPVSAPTGRNRRSRSLNQPGSVDHAAPPKRVRTCHSTGLEHGEGGNGLNQSGEAWVAPATGVSEKSRSHPHTCAAHSPAQADVQGGLEHAADDDHSMEGAQRGSKHARLAEGRAPGIHAPAYSALGDKQAQQPRCIATGESAQSSHAEPHLLPCGHPNRHPLRAVEVPAMAEIGEGEGNPLADCLILEASTPEGSDGHGDNGGHTNINSQLLTRESPCQLQLAEKAQASLARQRVTYGKLQAELVDGSRRGAGSEAAWEYGAKQSIPLAGRLDGGEQQQAESPSKHCPEAAGPAGLNDMPSLTAQAFQAVKTAAVMASHAAVAELVHSHFGLARQEWSKTLHLPSSMTSPEKQLSKGDCYWWQRQGPNAECRLKDKRDNTTACHVCQYQHPRWPCRSGKECKKSYCVRCIAKYDYLFEPGHEDDLMKFCRGWCPCCIGICDFIRCLRKTLKQLGQPSPENVASNDQEMIAALHLAFQLVGPAMEIYKENHAEAARQGVRLEDVPRVPVGVDAKGRQAPRSERILCNRCATTIVNVHYHCNCGVDFCTICVVELIGSRQGPVACFSCGKVTQLQQIFGKSVLQEWALFEKRLCQVFEEGPLSRWMDKAAVPLYHPSNRLWVVDGDPVSAYLRRVHRAQHVQADAAQQAMRVQHGAAASQCHGRKTQPWPEQHAQSVQGSGGVQLPYNDANAADGQPCFVPERPTCTTGIEAKLYKTRLESTALPALSATTAGLTTIHPPLVHLDHQAEPVAADASKPVALVKRLRRPTSKAQALQECQQQGQGSVPRPGLLSNVRTAQISQGGQPSSPSGNHSAHPYSQGIKGSWLGRHMFKRPGPTDIQMTEWWELERSWVSDADLRVVSQRPNGSQNVIWTPHVSVFSEGNVNRARAMRLFTQRWLLGEPIVVRGFQGRLDWSPDTMCRMTREMRVSSGEKVIHLDVVDCKDFSRSVMKCHDFFNKLYVVCDGATFDSKGKELPMYKLKDWPPEAGFAEKMARHNDDFVAMLARNTGMLNLVNHLPWYAKIPDLGPKGYIAYGREKEHVGEGDSVTKLHEDLSEAVNIMLHVQLPAGMAPSQPRCGPTTPWDNEHYGYAGAVWDIFRTDDREKLEQFLMQCVRGEYPDLPPFIHQGKLLVEADIQHPIHSQCFMLTEAHRQKLREEYDVHPWHVEQYNCEGVFVPAGSPHQVRNLRSSIKVALDFVTPESLGECLRLRQEYRELVLSDRVKEEDPGLYHYADRLQVSNMVLGGLQWAMKILEKHEASVKPYSERTNQ